MSDSAVQKALMPILTTICVGALLVLKAGFLFLLLALLPAIVAFFIDNTRGKSTFKSVLACNFAATLPTLAPMVKAGLQGKNYDAYAVMSNVSSWAIVLLGAAAGWGLVFLCRMIARFFLIVAYEYKIVTLKKLQARLIDEWGEQVTEK